MKSYQQPPSGCVKKREGKRKAKRESSPHTPYKRKGKGKGKGKETSPGCYKQPTSPRARARQGARYAEAGAAADELIAILGAQSTEYNRRLWAFYCYHHDIELILDKAYELASRKRQGEIENAVTAFQRWLQKSYGREAIAAVVNAYSRVKDWRRGGAR